MSKRIENLKRTIKENIAAGETGFLDTIPSIRDLTRMLGETRHVVNAALKELQEEQILLCAPQKGFRINPAVRARSSAPATRGTVETVTVIFTENLRWQTDHWSRMLRLFEQQNPIYKTAAHFIASTAKVAAFLDAHRGEPVVIVRTPDELAAAGVHFVPLTEIERCLGDPLIPRTELLPGLDSVSHADSMPYLLQPALLMIRQQKPSDAPDVRSFRHLLAWCRDKWGERSLMPLNTDLLLQRIGFWQDAAPDEEALLARLAVIGDLMRCVWENNLYYVDMQSYDRFAQARKILEDPIHAIARNSFYYGALANRRAECQIACYPLPLEPNGLINIPVCRLAIAGTACSPGAAKFFQFILSEDNQSAMLAELMGISPFKCRNQLVFNDPEQYPPHLSSIIRQLHDCPVGQLAYNQQYSSDLHIFVTQLITDKLILPMLSGRFPVKKSEHPTLETIARAIVEKDRETRKLQYVDSLRRQLLDH